MVGVCWQLDPVGGRGRWAVRMSVNECGDGAVLMWLRKVRRGRCCGCGRYVRVLLVPEMAGTAVPGRCEVCVIALMQAVLDEEASEGGTAESR